MERNEWRGRKRSTRLELHLSLLYSLCIILFSLRTRVVCLCMLYIERILIVIRAKISKIQKPQHRDNKRRRGAERKVHGIKSNEKTATRTKFIGGSGRRRRREREVGRTNHVDAMLICEPEMNGSRMSLFLKYVCVCGCELL